MSCHVMSCHVMYNSGSVSLRFVD